MPQREAFPLTWPESWKRTPRSHRCSSRFKRAFVAARDGALHELELLGAHHSVISSNMPLKSNGLPYATGNTPDDPGVAVWWVQTGEERVMACDRYLTVGENLRAIHLSIQALRGLSRWGASDITSRAFAGFAALPAGAPIVTKPDWWLVLEVDQALFTTLEPADLMTIVKARYRKLAPLMHPDRGGSDERMAELNGALAEAEAYLAKGQDDDRDSE